MDLSNVSTSDLMVKLAELQKVVASVNVEEPFWDYLPSDGVVDDEHKRFLEEWLLPEDVPQGRLDSQRDVHLSDVPIILAGGGNQGGKCLTYQTVIDTVDGAKTIGLLFKEGKPFKVYAWDGGKKVIANASAPFKKPGIHWCYRITMSDGRWVEAADLHRVLMNDGNYATVERLKGFLPCLQESSLDISQSAHVLNEQHCSEKPLDYLDGCSGDFHQYDEQSRVFLKNGQFFVPLQAGVQQRTGTSCNSDVQDNKHTDNPLSVCIHPSNPGVVLHDEAQDVELTGEVFYTTFQQSKYKHQELLQPVSESSSESLSDNEDDQNQFLDHEGYSNLFPLYVEGNQIVSCDLIPCQQEVYDFEVEKYHNYFAGGLVHHNTTLATVEGIIWSTGELPLSLEGIYPKSKLPTSWPVYGRVTGVDNTSLNMIILKAWERWLPKKFLLDGDWSKSWSAEYKTLTLYSGDRRPISTVQFKTNEQDTRGFQGNPLQWAIFDEQPDKDKYEETKARFITADRLKILFSMTPTEGLTWIKEDILDKEDGVRISCFKMPSICNRYAKLETLREILTGLDYPTIKMRLMGAFVSLSGLVYGNLFNEKLHLIQPFDLDDSFIVYRGVDPHLTKASACTEVAVNREGLQFITGCYQQAVDTEELKFALAQRAQERNYRLGWSVCDTSTNSNLRILGDINIYKELKRGNNAIPGLMTSEKFFGSISAGIDKIKQLLKVDPIFKLPKLRIFDIPENRLIMNAFKNMERDSFVNEEKLGMKDKILEGKWDNHACFRYVNQRNVGWLPPVQSVPMAESNY